MAETKVTKNEIEAQESWTAVTFQNGWVNFGGGAYGTVRYMKDSLGFVHLTGLMKSGTMVQTAFTLPAGYRPGFQLYQATASSGVVGIVDIAANGTVSPNVGNNGSFSLAGITFRAEN